MTQSGAFPTYRVTTRTGPEVNGVRLLFCGGDVQQGLSRIELQGMAGAWSGAGEATERASLQATRNAGTSPEVCGLSITCTGGTGPAQLHETPSSRIRITGFQLILAGGQRLPETALLAHEPSSWTIEHMLPPNTRFAGVILHMGRPTGPTGAEEDCCLIDVQVCHAGWLTANPNWHDEASLCWASPRDARARGPSGVWLRAQITDGETLRTG